MVDLTQWFINRGTANDQSYPVTPVTPVSAGPIITSPSYAMQTVFVPKQLNGQPFLIGSPPTGMPSSARYVLISAWIIPQNVGGIFGAPPDTIGALAIGGAFGTDTCTLTAEITTILESTIHGVVPVGTSVFCKLVDAAGNPIGLTGTPSTFPFVADATYHLLASFDTISNIVQFYINDVADTVDEGLFEWPRSENLAVASSSTPWGGPWAGTFGDVYVAFPGSFYDLSVTGNRRAFITAAGQPVYLGANGELPLGAQPAIFFTVPAPSAPPKPDQPVPNSLLRWRGQVGINWKGMALVGDAFDGVVGLSDFGNFTEYGNPMQFRVTTPPFHNDRKRISVPRFEIEVQAPNGMPLDPSAQPQMVLDWSKDGGKTWSTLQPPRGMGSIGQYIKRLRWLNLGQSRTWIFRLTCTDPVRRYIIGTYLDQWKGLG